MTIKDPVSNDLLSTFVDSINVFGCRLSSVKYIYNYLLIRQCFRSGRNCPLMHITVWGYKSLYLTLFYFASNFSYRYINIIWFCSNWLAMSNSCYNPFIYGLLNVSICRCLVYINIIWSCSNWLAMSNSCYNPFIYGLLNVSICRCLVLNALLNLFKLNDFSFPPLSIVLVHFRFKGCKVCYPLPHYIQILIKRTHTKYDP